MVVVGGITRLTHSGLSIVEWQPVVGALPPLNEAQWEETFAKYRQTPEFRLRNHDMTLAGFKGIFWWEYIHRLLGRLIGFVFIVPFLYFLLRRRVDRALAWRLGGIFVLGGLQGAMGWYMVKSGLVDNPQVSQFRLAAHLVLAFVIYAAMFWIAMELLDPSRTRAPRGARSLASSVAIVVVVMVLTGALVAGIRAGYAYNTFPLMNGRWIPPEILMIEPWWKNFGYNMATVQFNHRLVAYLLAVLVLVAWFAVMHAPGLLSRHRAWAHALLAATAIQIAIGIATLLLQVPVSLGALHQGGAIVVFTCALGLRQSMRGRAAELPSRP